MTSFGEGFAVGFLRQATEDIDKRKSAAQEYFQKSMETAMKYSQGSGNSDLKKSAQSAKASIAKLKGAGVPDTVINQIAGRDPKELEEYYSIVSELQADGSKIPPETFEGIFQVSKEQKENPLELTRRIKEPLAQNIKADPDAFKIDSVSSVWSTMMGYNAMERAQGRLEKTMIGDRSAADWIRSGESEDNYDVGPGIDYNMVGDMTRENAKNNKVDTFTPSEIMSVKRNYDDQVKEAYDKVLKSAGPDYSRLREDPNTMKAVEIQVRRDMEKYIPTDILDQALGGTTNVESEQAPASPESPVEAPSTNPMGLPSPKTREAYEALPSGSTYIDPNGVVRTKP